MVPSIAEKMVPLSEKIYKHATVSPGSMSWIYPDQ